MGTKTAWKPLAAHRRASATDASTDCRGNMAVGTSRGETAMSSSAT